ncbi:nucleotide sugar dehydrogenase [Ferrimonas balearica]|uniref:nucleotide sugar dehydrogenase n=1 Tax=Ferrimonas balearica TaxID=44012 RepID=UPI001C93BF16|nr:nucleotide sugar dehydrogenase [Ferrimonas balearica]MBY5981230.1 nucleotide sugar dehydrogenase [Ferrimonas balearica]
MNYSKERIVVVGLGYVGLPLAVLLAEKFDDVIGFDINQQRIDELRDGIDSTHEVEGRRVLNSGLICTSDIADIAEGTAFIVTVPTPTNPDKTPDLTPMLSASKAIGSVLKPGDLVVYESTVYPGVTEEECAPVLERVSGLKAKRDFEIGYSPERINPGDKVHTVDKIHKIVAGCSAASLERVANIYEPVISAGIHRAESIKVAEAAKVIENTQRDINIAMMNELSMICNKIGISTKAVIEAAGTKWNFHKYTPGMVGGHCIGVDPYYLASLAQRVGHNPEVILAGRRLNDAMHKHVAHQVLRMLSESDITPKQARIGLLGMTFKPNCPDLRNSRSFELLQELCSFSCQPMVHDAEANFDELKSKGINPVNYDELEELDMLIVAVGHDQYINDPALLGCIKSGGILIDIQSAYYGKEIRNDIRYWAL